jgi:hypothetical protein
LELPTGAAITGIEPLHENSGSSIHGGYAPVDEREISESFTFVGLFSESFSFGFFFVFVIGIWFRSFL